MKARILKGGWSWLGVPMRAGDIIDAPSAAWIANRVADNGLVEPIGDESNTGSDAAPDIAPEITSVPAAETATAPTAASSPRGSARKKGITDV